jgi:predicted nucleic acid-binding protein
MRVFVDTSALYAVLDRDDQNHSRARRQWERLLKEEAELLTSNYILIETCALLQHRLGLGAVRTLREDILPLISVEWISREAHDAALAAVLTADRKNLSLVDCSSFHVMRETGVRRAFVFDRHFAEQGFECRL